MGQAGHFCKHKMYCRHTLQLVGEFVHADAMLGSVHFLGVQCNLGMGRFLGKYTVMECIDSVLKVQAVLHELFELRRLSHWVMVRI